MQTPTLTLVDLVFGPTCTSLDPIDRALQIDEHIVRVAQLEGELEDVKHELSEVIEERDDAQRALKEADADGDAKEALRALVEAIGGLQVARYGKSGQAKGARVGDLVIVAGDGELADMLGEAYKAAKAAL